MTSLPPLIAEQIQHTTPCEFHGAEIVNGEWIATLTFSYPDIEQVFIYRIKLSLLNEYSTAIKLSKHLHDTGTPPRLIKEICLAIQQTRQYCNLFG
jgi:hypothetical protein